MSACARFPAGAYLLRTFSSRSPTTLTRPACSKPRLLKNNRLQRQPVSPTTDVYAITLALLASLVVANPVPELEKRAVTRLRWKHAGTEYHDRRILVVCGHGPYEGNRNGDQLSLAADYLRYCNPQWEFANGQLKSVGGNFCLDSTLNPGNGATPHIWQCYDDYWAQKWAMRSDGLIEFIGGGGGLCLDVRDGNPQSGIQLWECNSGNRNQQWVAYT